MVQVDPWLCKQAVGTGVADEESEWHISASFQ